MGKGRKLRLKDFGEVGRVILRGRGTVEDIERD